MNLSPYLRPLLTKCNLHTVANVINAYVNCELTTTSLHPPFI